MFKRVCCDNGDNSKRLIWQAGAINSDIWHLIPRLHDQAIIKQTSSKCIQNTCANCLTSARCLLNVCSMFAWCLLYVGYGYVCFVFARRLIDVCSIFAWLCKRGIKHSLHEANIKQTSSRHRANVEQTSSKHQDIRAHVAHVYFECICWIIARCLLDRVNGVLSLFLVGRQPERDRGVSVCGLDEAGASVNGLVARDASLCSRWNRQTSCQMQRLQRVPNHRF